MAASRCADRARRQGTARSYRIPNSPLAWQALRKPPVAGPVGRVPPGARAGAKIKPQSVRSGCSAAACQAPHSGAPMYPGVARPKSLARRFAQRDAQPPSNPFFSARVAADADAALARPDVLAARLAAILTRRSALSGKGRDPSRHRERLYLLSVRLTPGAAGARQDDRAGRGGCRLRPVRLVRGILRASPFICAIAGEMDAVALREAGTRPVGWETQGCLGPGSCLVRAQGAAHADGWPAL